MTVAQSHDRDRRGQRQNGSGTRPTKAAATAWRSRPTARLSTFRSSKVRTGTWSNARDGRRDRHHRDQIRLAQHHLRGRRRSTSIWPACSRRCSRSPIPKTHTVASTVGPFANVIRPFTVNGANTLVFVNVNGLLGFEVGDLKTGKKLYHVEVAGYQAGPGEAPRLPEPRHRADAGRKGTLAGRLRQQRDSRLRLDGDAAETGYSSIKARDCVGWVSFSMDGRLCLLLHGRNHRRGDEEDHRGAARTKRAARCRAKSCSTS